MNDPGCYGARPRKKSPLAPRQTGFAVAVGVRLPPSRWPAWWVCRVPECHQIDARPARGCAGCWRAYPVGRWPAWCACRVPVGSAVGGVPTWWPCWCWWAYLWGHVRAGCPWVRVGCWCACPWPVGVLAGLPGGLHAGAPARGFVTQRRSNSPKDIRQSLPQCRHKPGNVYHSGTLNSTYKANNEPPKEFFGWLRICRGLVRPPAPLHPAQKWLSQRSRQDPWGCQTDWAGHEKSIGKKWAEHSKPKLKVGMATS